MTSSTRVPSILSRSTLDDTDNVKMVGAGRSFDAHHAISVRAVREGHEMKTIMGRG